MSSLSVSDTMALKYLSFSASGRSLVREASSTVRIRSGMPLGFSAKSRILLITKTLRRTQNKAILCTDEAEEIPDQVRNDYWRHIGRRAGTPLAIYFVEMFVILNISN